MNKKLVTAEQELIEAVIREWEETDVTSMHYVLTTPSVQAALAKVRRGADLAAFGASEAAGYLYPGEDQLPERLAYCQGAADGMATPKSEPVLRWEGDWLKLGAETVGSIGRVKSGFRWRCRITGQSDWAPDRPTATAAAEQAVRDWLARAGVV